MVIKKHFKENYEINCPVGEERPKEIPEETQEEYSNKLFDLMSEYNEDEIKKLLDEKQIIKAIVLLHIHIAEQTRYLLLEKIRGVSNKDSSNKFINILKYLEEETMYEWLYNLGMINIDQKEKLNNFNTLRNKFVHGFNKDKRENYTNEEINRIIDEAKWTSNLLDKKIFKQK